MSDSSCFTRARLSVCLSVHVCVRDCAGVREASEENRRTDNYRLASSRARDVVCPSLPLPSLAQGSWAETLASVVWFALVASTGLHKECTQDGWLSALEDLVLSRLLTLTETLLYSLSRRASRVGPSEQGVKWWVGRGVGRSGGAEGCRGVGQGQRTEEEGRKLSSKLQVKA